MAALILSMLAASIISALLLRRRTNWRRAAPLLLTLSLPLLLWAIAFSIEAAPRHAEKLIGHSLQMPITRLLSSGVTMTGQWDVEVWFPIYRDLFLVSLAAGLICSFVNLSKGEGRAVAGSALAVAVGWGLLAFLGIAMAGDPFR
jgi:hypothetical protein